VPTRGVLTVEHVACEGPGLVAQALGAQDIELAVTRTYRGDAIPRDLDGASGLLVMGGPMGVYEADRYPHLRDELKLIERAMAAGAPVLGICLGSQLVARALGAEVRKGARKEIGWHTVALTQDALVDPLFKGLESSFVAFHWHGDVFDLPRTSTRLAGSDMTNVQGFRHGTQVYGLLFHMEVTREILEGMTKAGGDDLAEVGMPPNAILAGADEHLSSLSERAGRVFAGWADQVAAYRDAHG
jgi:GMP synthase (glutamine-hydrolysing)